MNHPASEILPAAWAPTASKTSWIVTSWPRQRPGAMAAILGLEDQLVETLCRKILGVWPANYNCPGQIVVSGENEAV